jgi:hypothetical protein
VGLFDKIVNTIVGPLHKAIVQPIRKTIVPTILKVSAPIIKTAAGFAPGPLGAIGAKGVDLILGGGLGASLIQGGLRTVGNTALVDPINFNTFSPDEAKIVSRALTGGDPMAFNIGGLLGSVSSIFGGGQNPIFSGISQVASLASNFFPTSAPQPQMLAGPVYSPPPQPMQQSQPVVQTGVPAVRSGGMLTQEVFNAGQKLLSRLGIPYRPTNSSFSSALKRALGGLSSLARRTPAGTIVSLLVGMGLAAQEANVLVGWHSIRRKGRRMNPANSRALKRAARRIKSFHKLCVHTDLIKTRRSSGGRSRCGSCKKSPCRC